MTAGQTAPLALQVEGLQVEAEGKSTRPILDTISLQVSPHETLGVVGVSGSGKSALVRAILGSVRPPGRIVGGQVVVDGEDVLSVSSERMRALRATELALIESDPRSKLNPVRTVGGQITDVILSHSEGSKSARKAAARRAVELLDQVGIPKAEERAGSYPHALSGGMCQRVVIAMALAKAPRMLIADEPTGGLDVTIQLQVLELFHALVRETGASALLVTRDLAIVAHYCHRVVVLHAGKVVESAPVESFFDRPTHPVSLGLIAASRVMAEGAGSDESGIAFASEVHGQLNEVGPGHYVRNG